MLNKSLLEQGNLIGKKTAAVYDPEFTRALKEVPWSQWLEKSPPFQCRLEYLETIHNWIHSTKLNQMQGLDRFSKRDLTIGTTQSFDEFYFRYSNRRLRFFKGEYAYHRRIAKSWKFLEDEPLEKNDAVIVSWPFCSTGEKHAFMTQILDMAVSLSVPVLIDCAYFGTCHGLNFDFSHPGIETVCFSISKSLGLGDIRSGIRYSSYEDEYPIRQQNNFNHTILADAKIGLYMMNKFSPDYIPTKYQESQKNVCADLNIQATPCMHIALGKGDDWKEYTIDDTYQRIGIRELVKARFKKNI